MRTLQVVVAALTMLAAVADWIQESVRNGTGFTALVLGPPFVAALLGGAVSIAIAVTRRYEFTIALIPILFVGLVWAVLVALASPFPWVSL